MHKEEMTLQQKIAQMFIVGFTDNNFRQNKNFMLLLENGLGGVIFFSHNIKTDIQFKKLIEELKNTALIPPFLSIDQEGGRVERTEKIHNGRKYLSAKNAFEMGLTFLQNQTKEIALELKQYGLNMNFSPVLDVNTNPDNPVIGDRAFSSLTEDVVNAAKVVLKEYEKYGIITVGKHFPGHGAADKDSHKTLPVIDLSLDELKNKHIKPFEEAIKLGIPAIMGAHVIYPAIENIPASVSEKIINDILINDLKFDGIIMTDDMEMNAIKGFSKQEACIRAIKAGVNMFIFRDATKDVLNLVNAIEKAVYDGLINKEMINTSIDKIFKLKYRYGIIQ